jgi:porin
LAASAAASDAAAQASAPEWEASAAYIGEWRRHASRGLAGGGAYLDHLQRAATVDAEELWGRSGWSFSTSVLCTNRNVFPERCPGDAETVSKFNASRAIRPSDFWAQWRSAGRAAPSVRAGLYDLNSEFDVIQARFVDALVRRGVAAKTANEFRNSTQLGLVFAQPLRLERSSTLGFGVSIADRGEVLRRTVPRRRHGRLR